MCARLQAPLWNLAIANASDVKTRMHDMQNMPILNCTRNLESPAANKAARQSHLSLFLFDLLACFLASYILLLPELLSSIHACASVRPFATSSTRTMICSTLHLYEYFYVHSCDVRAMIARQEYCCQKPAQRLCGRPGGLRPFAYDAR
jgi:hypothetical protein